MIGAEGVKAEDVKVLLANHMSTPPAGMNVVEVTRDYPPGYRSGSEPCPTHWLVRHRDWPSDRESYGVAVNPDATGVRIDHALPSWELRDKLGLPHSD
ncbi:MAG TPA: hypothetical protein VMT30_05425 [Candidatus Saccharimonadia bacterium]|nr:hypothetical protein [Candidatus Saccharimonadia bacterium]